MTEPPAPSHVATLLCDPSFPALAERHFAPAAAALDGAQPPQWLDKGIAADIAFASEQTIDCRALAEQLRAAIADPQIDVVVQPLAGRRKKLLLLDMDKVLLGQTTSDEIAAVIGAGTQRAEILAKVASGEISFTAGLQAFFALLQGRTTDCLSQVLGKRMVMRQGARALVETMRANGGSVAIATYGFSCFAGPVAQKANIQDVAANRLVLDGNKITALAEPLFDPAGKAAFLAALMTAQSRAPGKVLLALADPADLPLAAIIESSFAFHAAPVLAAATRGRIDQGDLSALLYIQGYARADFVTEERRTLDASDWKRKYGAYEKAHERTRL
jgi:phosphoserine phosphatase